MEKGNIEKRLLEFNNIIKENDDIYRCAAKNLGLSDSIFWILYLFGTEKNAFTQSEICNILYLPKQTIHSALKKMESDGDIRTEEMADRRSKLIRLTGKGERLAKETAERVIALECRAWSQMTEQEQQSFLTLFRKYTDLLKSSMQELDSGPQSAQK